MKSDEEVHNEFDFNSIETPSLSGHAWVQMGGQLVCQSCHNEHAIFLKPGYMYQGDDDKGVPIVKKIW